VTNQNLQDNHHALKSIIWFNQAEILLDATNTCFAQPLYDTKNKNIQFQTVRESFGARTYDIEKKKAIEVEHNK
jgi:thiamine pyrophosphate-dependent acetolactate synthase large subunit-like protein